MKNVIRFFVFSLLVSIFVPYLQAQSVFFPDDARNRGYYDRSYKRYEAEPCRSASNGTYLAPSFDQREIQCEASNQQAVQLTATGDYVQWTNDEAADGLIIRFSIPDAPGGGGTKGIVALYVNNEKWTDIELDSYWAWQYFHKTPTSSQYADNTPDNDKFPLMRFDEIRVKLDKKIPKNAKFKLVKVDNNGVAYTIDFVELEAIPAKVEKPANAVEYTGSDLVSFVANNGGKTIYIPEGKYDVPTRLYINNDNTKLIGAGMWHTQLHFTANPNNTGNTPSNPNSYNARGIESFASNVEISGLYITTENERRHHDYATQQMGKGLNGSFGANSKISDVWVIHFACSAWFDGADNLQLTRCRFRNNYADGVNFSYGSQNCSVTHSSFRNNGDDDMASWSRANRECFNTLFEYNTSENSWRAAGIGFFGGKQHKARHCVVIDPLNGGIRINSDFDGAPFSNDGEFELSDISIYKAGTKSNNGAPAGITGTLWGWATGAIFLRSNNAYSYDVKNIRLSNIDIYDSKGHAVMIQCDGDRTMSNVHFENITVNTLLDPGIGTGNIFGVNFNTAKGSNNTLCIHYINVPENRKKNLANYPAGFTELTNCSGTNEIPLTGLCISPNNFKIKVGETINPASLVSFLPENNTAADKTLHFSIMNGAGKVSISGQEIVGLEEGKAVVRISAAANTNIYTEIDITVTDAGCTPIQYDRTGWEATVSYSTNASLVWGVPNDVFRGSAWSALVMFESGTEFMVNMQKTLQINQIVMRNEGNDWERRLLEYELYVSDNGISWGTAVASGSFRDATESPLVIDLPEPQTARYFKIVYLGDGYQWSMNELWVTYCETLPVGATFDIAREQIVAGYYDILGRKLRNEPTSGIYIIKYENGTAIKTVR